MKNKKLYATLDIYGEKIKLQIIQGEENGYAPKTLGKHQIKIKHECFGVLCKGNQSMTIKIKKETLDKITQDYYGDRK
jgi:hypothetical protein